MEYAIAIFVGLWIAAAGMLAYLRVKKDFDNINTENKTMSKENEK